MVFRPLIYKEVLACRPGLIAGNATRGRLGFGFRITGNVGAVLAECRDSVYHAGPAFSQHCRVSRDEPVAIARHARHGIRVFKSGHPSITCPQFNTPPPPLMDYNGLE